MKSNQPIWHGILHFVAVIFFTASANAQDSLGLSMKELKALKEKEQEVLSIQSGKFKLETDLLNQEMGTILKKQRSGWKTKPPTLTSDDSLTLKDKSKYNRRKSEIRKKIAPEKPGDAGSSEGDKKDFAYEKEFLEIREGLTRTRPRAGERERLSLKERMQVFRKEEKLILQARLASRTEEGRLKSKMTREPFKTHQESLTRISRQIGDIKAAMKKRSNQIGDLYFSLGKSYLESQEYLETIDPKPRLQLIRFSEFSNTTLGSYDLAAWALKLAIADDPSNQQFRLLLNQVLAKSSSPPSHE